MAETLNLPKQVVDYDYKQNNDVSIDYAILGNDEESESNYEPISKEDTELDPAAIEKIKAFNEKIAFRGLSRFRKAQLKQESVA